MAWTSIGYDGTVTEAQWPNLTHGIGARDVVFGQNDMKVTASATTRSVSVAPGTHYQGGVTAINDAIETLNLAANTSGSTRYDTIVIVRDWSTNTTSYAVRAGGSGVGRTVTTGTSGVRTERPLAVVPVPNSATNLAGVSVIDTRSWNPHYTVSTGSPLVPNYGDMWENPGVGTFRYDGTNWIDSRPDTGWVARNLLTGFSGFLFYRVRDGVIFVSFSVTVTSDGNGVARLFSTLPAAYAPSIDAARGAAAAIGEGIIVTAYSNGQLALSGTAAGVKGSSIHGSISYPIG